MRSRRSRRRARERCRYRGRPGSARKQETACQSTGCLTSSRVARSGRNSVFSHCNAALVDLKHLVNVPDACAQAIFRGFFAAASLKRTSRYCVIVDFIIFRGFFAAASLKRSEALGDRVLGREIFRGFFAAASLKRMIHVKRAWMPANLPRFLCRGLFEAPGSNWMRRVALGYLPRFLCRGLIEATVAAPASTSD